MFKDADPLAIAILTLYAVGALVSIIVLALGIWLIRKMYRRMLARQQRFAGPIAIGAFIILVVAIIQIFSMVF